MTVICWDGRYVTADSQGKCGGRKINMREPKVVERNGVIYATTGFWGLLPAWIDWHLAGANPKETPVHGHTDNDVGSFVVIMDGRRFVYSMIIPYPIEEFPPVAFGSGQEFAMGAMLAGADARRAAEIAANVDAGCGGPIQVIDLHTLVRKDAA